MVKKVLGNTDKGLLFIVSAPAGTGKTTLVRMLVEEFSCIIESVSCTTRPKRAGEIEGKDYFFLSEEEFEKKLKTGDFLEYAKVFGHHYGTSRGFVEKELRMGKHVVLVIDTQGALQLKGKIAATTIFLQPPSLEELRERLVSRKTDSPESIEKRLAWAVQELRVTDQYDYQIVNDDLAVAYEVLRSIIIAEEHRTKNIIKRGE